jgi:hypothetical protein
VERYFDNHNAAIPKAISASAVTIDGLALSIRRVSLSQQYGFDPRCLPQSSQ